MSKYTKYIVRFIVHFPLFVIYGVSFLYPRNKRIWVFGSRAGSQFTDNSKHLFLYMSQPDADIRVVWISHNPLIVNELREVGHEAHHWLSFRGLLYSMRAGVYVFDSYANSINYWLSGGAVLLNLWHGIPLKKIEADVTQGKSAKIYNATGLRFFLVRYLFPWIFSTERTIVTAPSITLAPIFSSAFRVSTQQIVVSGLPRNDALFKEDTNYLSQYEKQIIRQMKNLQDEGFQHIIYMPTFRDSGGDPLKESGIDLVKLNNVLKIKNLHLWCKYHPAAQLTFDFSSCSNVHSLVDSADPYVLLQYTNALITDYSSIYFDYLLLNKPILFYAYDFTKYLSQDRDMYFDYNEVTPGPICKNFSELLQEIQSLDKNSSQYKAERVRICKSVHHGGSRGSQTEHLLGQVRTRLKI